VNGHAVLPGSEIVLLGLAGDPFDPTFIKARDNVRAVLRVLTVVVECTDI
jgi:hypothetical protein